MSSVSYSSPIYEKYSEKYDSRVERLQNSGEIFDPMLNRYSSVLRLIIYKLNKVFVDNVFYDKNGKTERLREIKREIILGSAYSKLKAGVNIVNMASEYSISKKVHEAYHVNEWNNLVFDLVDYRIVKYTPANNTYEFSGMFKNESTGNWDNPVDCLRRKMKNSTQNMYLISRIDDLYLRGLYDIAKYSFKNIKGWSPNKFNKKVPEQYRGSVNSYCSLALVSLEKLSQVNDDIDYLLKMIESEAVIDIVTSVAGDFVSYKWADAGNYLYDLRGVSKDLAEVVEYCLQYIINFHSSNYVLREKQFENFKKIRAKIDSYENENNQGYESNKFSETSMFGEMQNSDTVINTETYEMISKGMQNMEASFEEKQEQGITFKEEDMSGDNLNTYNNSKDNMDEQVNKILSNPSNIPEDVSREALVKSLSVIAHNHEKEVKKSEDIRHAVLTLGNVLKTTAESLSAIQEQLRTLTDKM